MNRQNLKPGATQTDVLHTLSKEVVEDLGDCTLRIEGDDILIGSPQKPKNRPRWIDQRGLLRKMILRCGRWSIVSWPVDSEPILRQRS